jgi:hypothetical protein
MAVIGAAVSILALGAAAHAAPYLVGATAGSSTSAGANSVLYSYNYNVLDQFPGTGYRYVPSPCASNSSQSCVATGSGPTSLGDTLTAASVAVQASDSGVDFYGNPFDITASSSASANLATGALSITAVGGYYGANAQWGVATSQAVLYDTLTFNIPGAGPSTVTDIAVAFNDTGSLDPTTIYGGGSLGNVLRFGNGAYSDVICVGCGGSEALAVTGSSASGWVSDSLSPDGLDFSGVVAVTGANPVVTLEAYFNLTCQDGASCGYDGTVSVTPPAGVTFTSASNVFLSGAAPEPATWALMLAGFAAVGGALRTNRRRTAANPAPL